ncbi:LOG family protein [Microcoleus sp. LEGE 07076]|uniref:LOG family protein n=1 Tax=Microcoleus sp. LEGE 07076 TaxID=915322 RepID=UPI001881AB6E|nr:LOG family protein [Microcoleus sp. LEGE 07076]MBE9186823.1 LOG family protein [Microcoleus sp. LEGE 07076]
MVASGQGFESLQADVLDSIARLPMLKHSEWIERSLSTIVRMAGEDLDRLDWKIISSSLRDMEKAFSMFYPYRHVRKIVMFGSARVSPESPEYQMAKDFGTAITQQGFMVITGGGGGIMQAGNEGATAERSFGLNIQLPFEQGSNPFIAGDRKALNFKYFFTRKLFFLRESDALALFPGGFGTLDEAFECLTLTQTGKFGPAPLVLIDRPGGDYWHDWDAFVQKQLRGRGLIAADDRSLYTITDNVEVACEAIASFYLVYHSCRYVNEKLVIRLKSELSDSSVEQLNANFSDIVVTGKIEKSQALTPEIGDETFDLPRLTLHFNQRNVGRLYQLIATINQMGAASPAAAHPEQK